jgi:galactonate dehydratase
MSNNQNRRSFLTKASIAGAAALAAPLSKTFGQGLIDAKERTSQASAPTDLKITEVKCAYAGGGLFVKIYTNQGIWGSGEGVDAIAGTYYLVKRLDFF